MHTISLDASIAMTGISRSTLWRRVTDGSIATGEKDARGRATLALTEVLELAQLALGDEDVTTLLCADAGDADAQADVGALCQVAGAYRAALYWLGEAAAQNHADAMQWLATAYAAGADGTPAKDENLAVMWLARAAALGHAIAREQMQQLLAQRR